MRGQIVRRGPKRYLVRLWLGRDDAGRRLTHNKTIRGTRDDAERYLNNALRERDLGVLIEPAKITLDEYLDRWLEDSAKGRVRARTLLDYMETLDRYVRPTIGKVRLSRLSPIQIQGLYREMQDKGLSARTVRYAHAVLRNALGQAVKWRMLPTNPATAVDLPRQVRREMQSLTPEQAASFLKFAVEDELGALFVVGLATGMRPGEYLGLQWKDVDLGSGRVVVRRTLVRFRDGGWEFGEPKTARSNRSIPLPPGATKVLVEHRRRQAEQRLAAGGDYISHDLVFATPKGLPLEHRNVVNRHFKPILKAAGLPTTLRLYDLRHSCATLLLAQDEHPKVVSERLGHASVTLTLDTYSHVLPTMQEKAAEKLEAVLFGEK